MATMKMTRFARYAWGVLAYNILVVLWGAVVRATASGAGCGDHWPLCGGQVIPDVQRFHTAIEFAHRVSSFVVIPLVIVLLVWALRVFPPRHSARLGALLCVIFTFSEALLGAGLVLYKLVEHNKSVYRAMAMSAHLTNTLILLLCLTLTAWWGMGGRKLQARGQGAVGWAVALALVGMIVLAVSGAIAALGVTLFPATSLAEGLRQDFSPTAHFLIRLRILHPLLAITVGLYLLLVAGLVTHLRPSEQARQFARWTALLFIGQWIFGALTLTFHAPTWMQVTHLFLADLTWVSAVLLGASTLAEGVPQVELGAIDPAHLARGGATYKDYLALTKPRVISLLLFTTLTAMFIARDAAHRVSPFLFLAVAIGGYMAAGAANAINMVIDRDIDGLMKRTASRPTVTQTISSQNALRFAFATELLSFAILWQAANLLTAMLALAGLVFYVIVYTLGLKRRTWHNIVIGGAAGAFPPLVGWAAVTDSLSPLAWFLFAIIFVWTPVHFWALALLIKEDYASVGVPMLPVVRGDRVTVVQIGMYAIFTTIVSLLPFFTMRQQIGWVYLISAVVLNALLLLRSFQLYQDIARPRASRLFHYSMLYLALLFLLMAVDRSIHL